ncbi:hypothetical protein FIV42_26150 [Persicimonas caeni]|uniref:Uncharacterized protein n=1 Tax=Persicimonas caeni TaxID=2292766 RepID=A0A4Y6Q0J2_PERCE|nr:hypothetical protein [Persicimonas caeni]QDG54096.1 hypothetical protein FIV42_26150 [Persicimonas caeni]QED35317.1 hypothetical protein FRD00_26145 [Persicimonas caeni]
MRLYEEAKESGGWDPAQLDFSVDRAHWEQLPGADRLPIMALTVLSANGLRAQMHNSATLMMGVERHGSIEDSLCFSSLVFETARQIELYNLLIEDIFHLVGDPQRFTQTKFETFFDKRLPETVDQLRTSLAPSCLVEALTLSEALCKGVLSTTASHILHTTLERLDVMPTSRQAVHQRHLAAVRHTEFGTFFVGKLVRRDPSLWEVVDQTMNSGFEPVISVVREFFDKFTSTSMSRAEAVTYAVERFSRAYELLERAKDPGTHGPQNHLVRRLG